LSSRSRALRSCAGGSSAIQHHHAGLQLPGELYGLLVVLCLS
jgi:hypothetical protein